MHAETIKLLHSEKRKYDRLSEELENSKSDLDKEQRKNEARPLLDLLYTISYALIFHNTPLHLVLGLKFSGSRFLKICSIFLCNNNRQSVFFYLE